MRPLCLCSLLIAASSLFAAPKRAVWRHTASPYRCAFKVKTQPNVPKAGYFLEVPLCGIGDPGGRNVFAADEKGRELPVYPIGPGRPNTALVLVGGERLKGRIYAYFGSTQRPPNSRSSFTPGLVLEVRRAPPEPDVSSWDKVRRMLDKAPLLGAIPAGQINWSTNPIDATDSFIMDFRGHLKAEMGADWELMLASDDAGYLFVDDKLVIERNGRRSARDAVRGQGRKKVRVRKGLNRVRCVVVDVGGAQMAVLARWVDRKAKFVLPIEYFAQSGLTELEKVETRQARQSCPAFSVKQSTYIATGKSTWTAIELASLTGESLQWRLSNGARGEGRTFKTIAVGVENISVSTRSADKSVGKGRITFAAVPRRTMFKRPRAYQLYARQMLAQDLEELDATTLRGYFDFLALRERNSDLVPVGEALLARTASERPSKNLAKQAAALRLGLARAAARDAPEQARKHYHAYFGMIDAKKAAKEVLEYLEFEVYRNPDATAAAKALATAGRSYLDRDHPGLTLLKGELALLRGDAAAAEAQFAALRLRVARSEEFRRAAVVGNALLERHKIDLKGGFFALAEDGLREWGLSSPESLSDGHYALRRAQLLRRMGWQDSALRVLDGFLKAHKLPAFLPDLELERAETLAALKRRPEAKTAFKRIVESFPNHPAAERAKTHLQ